MSDLPVAAWVLAGLVAWVGHACVCTAGLNYLYGCPLPKGFLKPFRILTGLTILAFPLLARSLSTVGPGVAVRDPADALLVGYAGLTLLVGGVVFPAVTVSRLRRKPPPELLAERTETLDLWAELGPAAVGDGKGRRVARLPGNCVFRVDFTELTLAPPGLPAAWDGLTLLLVSDVHFHGTPSRAWFDRVFAEVARRWPVSDLVCLAGDYVDSDAHRGWIGPLLGPLRATAGKFAVLGNHDAYHDPAAVRAELAAAGYDVLGNGWRAVTVRGERLAVVGHEGPWFRPGPAPAAPPGAFRLCLSHAPSNVYWAARAGAGLVLAGHVHGGQVRVPVVGSIFVPSRHGRRFDQGVYAAGGAVLVVCRGLSGKEPLRFRCHPQVVRITLAARPAR